MKLALFALGISTLSLAQNYIVRPLEVGETISDILYNDNYSPLYGENEWVEKVLKLNRLSESQARKLEKGTLLIVPGLPKAKDRISIRQSSISRSGLLSNRISDHQEVNVGFELYSSDLDVDDSTVSSNENYGVSLSYTDKNKRKWNQYSYNPQLKLSILGHGANQSTLNSVATYDPTFKLSAKAILRQNTSRWTFGPLATFEQASRATKSADELTVRRDNAFYAGAFVAREFKIKDLMELTAKLNLQRSIVESNSKNLGSLDALRNEFVLGTRLTSHTSLEIFTQYETYENSSIDNRFTSGASLTYLIK
ncbi:MAG: hypothetical protein KC478_12535 [Bacteriovoracaceae bacterium]|nr:hypothetical protein [Bacteriovoracaceae bacterium]